MGGSLSAGLSSRQMACINNRTLAGAQVQATGNPGVPAQPNPVYGRLFQGSLALKGSLRVSF